MNLSFSIGKRKFSFGSEREAVETPLKMPRARRSFDAATIDRLTADWFGSNSSADTEISSNVRTLRNRSRDLERNNEYAVRYLTLLDNNVLGADGVGAQFKALDKFGNLDKLDNQAIQKGWEEWKKREFCTMSGALCWREVEGLTLRSTARDGGVLIRKINAPNKFKFSLQMLEIDYLDLDYNARMANGNEVRFGVEFDGWRKPVAFYLLTANPGDVFQAAPSTQRIRVAATDIIHTFWHERVGQTVGIPWMAAVMRTLRDLGKYREAEIIAARVSACKGFAITPATPENYSGPEDSDGNVDQSMEPGQGLLLNPGDTFHEIDPTHPNTAFGEFMKGGLRGIAAGLGVNYNSLANDLESVNYSSMRAGKLEEIEEYKAIQSWLIENLHQPVFEAWLESALMAGALTLPGGSPLPMSKFDKFNSVQWKPRRWPWVDPLKDLQAAVLKVEKGFGSRRSIIAEMGGDIEDVFQEQEEDNKLADEHNLDFPIDIQKKPEILNPATGQTSGGDPAAQPAKMTPQQKA